MAISNAQAFPIIRSIRASLERMLGIEPYYRDADDKDLVNYSEITPANNRTLDVWVKLNEQRYRIIVGVAMSDLKLQIFGTFEFNEFAPSHKMQLVGEYIQSQGLPWRTSSDSQIIFLLVNKSIRLEVIPGSGLMRESYLEDITTQLNIAQEKRVALQVGIMEHASPDETEMDSKTSYLNYASAINDPDSNMIAGPGTYEKVMPYIALTALNDRGKRQIDVTLSKLRNLVNGVRADKGSYANCIEHAGTFVRNAGTGNRNNLAFVLVMARSGQFIHVVVVNKNTNDVVSDDLCTGIGATKLSDSVFDGQFFTNKAVPSQLSIYRDKCLAYKFSVKDVMDDNGIKELAKIQPTSKYVYHTFVSPKSVTLTKRGREYKLTKGDVIGIRASTSKKAVYRVIVKQYGPTIIFSLSQADVDKLIKRCTKVKK